jgi:hypothetical protein
MNRRSALKKAGVLAGSAVAIPSFFSLLQSCKSETRLGWKPLFFTETEANTIAAILDMILPRTDTPGALDVKSDIFIDKVIAAVGIKQPTAAIVHTQPQIAFC